MAKKLVLLFFSAYIFLAGIAQGALTQKEMAAIISTRDTNLVSATGYNALNANVALPANFSGANGTFWLDVTQYFGAQTFRSMLATVTGSSGISAGQIRFEQTNDSLAGTISTLNCWDANATSPQTFVTQPFSVAASTAYQFAANINMRFFRCRVTTAFTGGTISSLVRLGVFPAVVPFINLISTSPGSNNATVNGNITEDGANGGFKPVPGAGKVKTVNSPTTFVEGDIAYLMLASSGALVVQPFAVPETQWSYVAAAGGILNTATAVTVKAALVNYRNYVTSIQIQSEPLTTATEFAIRDGAAGPVLWRFKIPTTGLPLTTVQFQIPLRPAAVNTLLEVVTLTASGAGAVYVNVQGYTAL
jgi:hypothetical protein